MFAWEAGPWLVEASPKAAQYASDGCAVYRELLYPQPNSPLRSKFTEEPHTIESVNADCRHYLGRLLRRSRCFSRRVEGARCALRLFQCAHNYRQLLRHKGIKRVPGLCDCFPALS